MAVVNGIKEKVHLPIYDSIKVDPEEQLRDSENSSTLKFFVDVQGKTKLETNLQSAGLLPHYNTFEARAMRVVISDLPAQFPDEPTATSDPFPVTNDQDQPLFFVDGNVTTTPTTNTAVTGVVELGLSDLIDQLQAAKDSPDGTVDIPAGDGSVTLFVGDTEATSNGQTKAVEQAGGIITLSVSDLEDLLDSDDISDQERPLDEQIDSNNGSGTLIGKIVYNTVTTFYVGEKIMIQMPTWFFPAGAGPYSEGSTFSTHGEPSPMATFRFATEVNIDRGQNFKVEIEIPDSDVLKELQRIYGPFFIWVVLDGYMTRDVQ
jgi:hypothetical protein